MPNRNAVLWGDTEVRTLGWVICTTGLAEAQGSAPAIRLREIPWAAIGTFEHMIRYGAHRTGFAIQNTPLLQDISECAFQRGCVARLPDAGKFPFDFGALNRGGVERRLNVAVNRIKQRMLGSCQRSLSPRILSGGFYCPARRRRNRSPSGRRVVNACRQELYGRGRRAG